MRAELAVTDAKKPELIEIRQRVDLIKGSVPLPGAMEMWVVRDAVSIRSTDETLPSIFTDERRAW